MIQVQWGIVIASAIGVVGVMEWAKGWFASPKKWLTRVLLPILAFVIALFSDGSWGQIGINTALIWAIGQIGYDLIIASVKKLIESKAQ